MMANDTTSKLRDWIVEPLEPHHTREVFDCGVESLNIFLRQQAGQNAKKGVSRTFVAVTETDAAIVGYYTLAMSSLGFHDLPNEKHLSHYPIPIAYLGRLAVDLQYRGRHIGEFLLFHALQRVQVISEQIGVFAVEVKALDEAVSQFYIQYGFVPISDDPLHLYITLKSIRKFDLR
jgi:predicted GNAT family N-acyltransferase